MSIKDSFRKGVEILKEDWKRSHEIRDKNRELLKDLTMPELKKLASDYDVPIIGIFDEPGRSDYIRCISNNLSTERIQKFLEKNELRGIIMSGTPRITIIKDSDISINKGSLGGDATFYETEFNKFVYAVSNSEIDLNLKMEAFRKIEELKNEIENPKKDKNKIQQICDWFKNNKHELATIAIPFIEKILGL